MISFGRRVLPWKLPCMHIWGIISQKQTTATLPTGRPLCLLAGHSACWQSTLPAGRPLCLLAGHTACWQATLPAGRPLCLLAGHTACWQVTLHAGRPHCILAGHSAYWQATLPTGRPLCLLAGHKAWSSLFWYLPSKTTALQHHARNLWFLLLICGWKKQAARDEWIFEHGATSTGQDNLHQKEEASKGDNHTVCTYCLTTL